MNRTILVTGATGVGKSSVARALAAAQSAALVQASKLVYQVARELLGVDHRDAIKRLSADQQRPLHERARHRIRTALATSPLSVLDDHLVVAGSSGQEWIAPPEDYAVFYRVTVILLLVASPDEILARQEADSTKRMRPERTPEQVAAEQERLRRTARSLAGQPRVLEMDTTDCRVAEIVTKAKPLLASWCSLEM